MTHFNKGIARLFFEIEGFLVRINVPLPVGKGSPDSDIDLAVMNITVVGILGAGVAWDHGEAGAFRWILVLLAFGGRADTREHPLTTVLSSDFPGLNVLHPLEHL